MPTRKQIPTARAMTVAGIMSGTSADGIDVALVRITHRADSNQNSPKIKLLAHHAVPFSTQLRAAVLASMDAKSISTAELARLNWHLGVAYADALRQTLKKHPLKIDLIGCHGQTIYHQPAPAPHSGKRIACTWQIGEMAMLAAAAGAPVVSNFRPADMVAGGQGAPLVPLLDFVLFHHPARGRVLQNLGGIGNLTAIPPGASLTDILAFDTGPANMVIDALAAKLFNKAYDSAGKIAATGKPLSAVVQAAMRNPFFRRKPPKSAGREQFGADFASSFLDQCNAANGSPEDAIATATALTAQSVAEAYRKFVQPLMRDAAVDFFVSGGGANNDTLVNMLRDSLAPLGCKVATSDRAGLPPQAKEAVAFALLAYETWHRRPGNVPAATGASRLAILGSITYA